MPLHEDCQVRTVKCRLPGDIVGKKSDVPGAARPQGCDKHQQAACGRESGGNKCCDGAKGHHADRVERGDGALRPGPREEAVSRQPCAESPDDEEQQC